MRHDKPLSLRAAWYRHGKPTHVTQNPRCAAEFIPAIMAIEVAGLRHGAGRLADGAKEAPTLLPV
jgi:hypothetical protein